MSPKTKGDRNRVYKDVSLDLYEAGDHLAPYSFYAERAGQTATHTDRTLPSDFLSVRKSGWMKPSIQLGALLYLESRGELTLHGKRRLHRLLRNISSQEVEASQRHKERISKSPKSFGVLLRWIQRPLSFQSFKRRERRRIGVGYRDKGSLPPSHSQGRRERPDEAIYLGEEMEYIDDLRPVINLVGAYGYPLFHHLSDGWWIPLKRPERMKLHYWMLQQALAKY